MSIEIHTIQPRSDTRIRLVFSNHLGAGAFTTPSHYSLTAVDALGADPGVKAVIAIAGNDTNAEIVTQNPLSPGGRYLLTAIGVPAQDASTSTTASNTQFVFGDSLKALATDVQPDNTEIVLYGSDLIWTGLDFQETANGDLARVQGVTNVMAAINRGLFAEGLPYDPTYGAHPRQYVDAPRNVAGDLRTSIIRFVVSDDRVQSVKVNILPDATATDEVTFQIAPKLIGNITPQAVSAAFSAS